MEKAKAFLEAVAADENLTKVDAVTKNS